MKLYCLVVQWLRVQHGPNDALAEFVVDLLFGAGKMSGGLCTPRLYAPRPDAAALLRSELCHAAACLDPVRAQPATCACKYPHCSTGMRCYAPSCAAPPRASTWCAHSLLSASIILPLVLHASWDTESSCCRGSPACMRCICLLPVSCPPWPSARRACSPQDIHASESKHGRLRTTLG
jgi:hypothetical protein